MKQLQISRSISVNCRSAQSVYKVATGWTVEGSNPGEGEIFRTRPDRPWDPPNGYWVSFPEVKRPERGANHLPPSSAEVKEKVQRYLCSPSGPLWPVLWQILPLYFLVQTI